MFDVQFPVTTVAPLFTAVACALTAALLYRNAVGNEGESTLETANYAQVLVLVLISLMGTGQVVSLTTTSVAAKGFGLYLTMAASCWVAPAWLVFALLYTGRAGLLTRRRVAALAVLPTALTVAAATGGLHGGTLVDPHLVADGARTLLAFQWGVVPWLIAGHAWFVCITAIKFLVEKFLTSRNVYRKISFLHILGGIILPFSPFFSLTGLSPFEYLVLGPTAFSAVILVSAPTALTYRYLQFLPLERFLAVFGGRFRSLTPMARDTIMENMDSGVLVVDHDNRLVDINPLARQMIAAEDRRVVGKPLKDIVSADVYDTDDTRFLDPTTVDETYRGIWTNAVADKQRCFDIQVTALGPAEEPAGRVALISDVTDREIRKEQLQQRTRELERQNQQLEQFAGVVSHDLRNPLTVAKGYLDGAKDVDDDAELLAEAEQSLDRMEAIIDDVLRLAQEGQSIGSTAEVSLDGMARDAWANVETDDARVVVAEDETFDADRDRLLNLFENLFRNSIEHGGDAVTVTVGWDDDGFFVADDGPGIPADERRDVTASGYTTADTGTGFGLAIVDQIADAHGWTLHVGESDEGGACFWFRNVHRSNIPVHGDARTQ